MILRGIFRLVGCAFAAFLVCQLPWWLIGSLAVAGAIALVPALGEM